MVIHSFVIGLIGMPLAVLWQIYLLKLCLKKAEFKSGTKGQRPVSKDWKYSLCSFRPIPALFHRDILS